MINADFPYSANGSTFPTPLSFRHAPAGGPPLLVRHTGGKLPRPVANGESDYANPVPTIAIPSQDRAEWGWSGSPILLPLLPVVSGSRIGSASVTFIGLRCSVFITYCQSGLFEGATRWPSKGQALGPKLRPAAHADQVAVLQLTESVAGQSVRARGHILVGGCRSIQIGRKRTSWMAAAITDSGGHHC